MNAETLPQGFVEVPLDDAPPPAAPPAPDANVSAAAVAGLTEDGIALAFAAAYRDKLLHDHDAGRWLEWCGSHWRECRTPIAFHYARELSRLAVAVLPERDRPKTPLRAAFAAAVERLAAADPVFARHSGDFDHDPWLLATPGGTVDLKTGTLRAADPADMLTRCTSVTPAARAECPRWLRFLDDATQGDAELIAYLQRFAGYALTGLTIEHVLMFVYGTGKNGKTTFVNALQHVLGDHAVVAPAEVFAASHHDRHPTELAMLRGARLVVASETEEGRAWAEARVKALTGGDPVTARFMRRDYFTFVPTLKLLIVGNHKPVLRNVDEAMRRRIHIVPFTHKPPQPDPHLGEALRAEGPGILRWMIDGCLAWRRHGLAPPAAVRDATEEYLSDQDAFAQWAAERLIFGPDLSERPGTLLTDFGAWASQNGEAQRSRHALRAWLDRQNLGRRTVRGVDYVRGVALRRDDDR
jgi:putative DNA primase/helicase